MLEGLGVPKTVPMVGYVFSEAWARSRSEEVGHFLAAAAAARSLLASSDDEWQRIRPLTEAKTDAELDRLRDWYRSGVPGSFGPQAAEAADQLYRLLREAGGAELTGPSPELAKGTFWTG